MITQNPEKAEKLNTLINAVHGEASMCTGPLRALVQEITQVDLCPLPFRPTYKIGDRFAVKGAREYIIAVAGTEPSTSATQDVCAHVVAINLLTGARRSMLPIAVCNRYAITETELKRIMKVPSYYTLARSGVTKTQSSGAQPFC